MIFFFSQFASKRSDETVMNFGPDIIGVVKINSKVFCKDDI